jgi:hypothetical protein
MPAFRLSTSAQNRIVLSSLSNICPMNFIAASASMGLFHSEVRKQIDSLPRIYSRELEQPEQHEHFFLYTRIRVHMCVREALIFHS